MTPEEVFAQLRDIHAPGPTLREAAAYDFRPLLLFAALLLTALIMRGLWRRASARRALARIDASAPPALQRDALIRLAGERPADPGDEPAPDAAFARPERLTPDTVRRLRRWVLRRIG